MSNPRFSFAFYFLLLAQMSWGQTGTTGNSLLTNPVFQKNCAKCHGKTAEGRHFGGPSLISERTRSTSDEELLNIVSKGKGRMPKYGGKLSSEEITTLLQQIRSANTK